LPREIVAPHAWQADVDDRSGYFDAIDGRQNVRGVGKELNSEARLIQ
jgi:hypothetical protein